MARRPSPRVDPRDSALAPVRDFLLWAERRLGGDIQSLVTADTDWNPGSVADGASTSTTVAVDGARIGDHVSASHTSALAGGVWLSGSVTANDTVTVTLANLSGGSFNLADGTLRVAVWRYA